MPKLKYSERFADDLAAVTSLKVQREIDAALDNIEAFPDIGNANVPVSIREEFGDGVRKVVVGPFDLIYTSYPESDEAVVEALINQRRVR